MPREYYPTEDGAMGRYDYYYPPEEVEEEQEYVGYAADGGGGGRGRTVAREVLADGTILERIERTLPDGSKTMEETITAPAVPASGGYRYSQRHAPEDDSSPVVTRPPQKRHASRDTTQVPNKRHQTTTPPTESVKSHSCCGDLPTFGAQAECPPRYFPRAKEGAIEWAWFPEWSWLRILLTLCVIIKLVGLILLIQGALSFNGGGLIAGGMVLLLVGFGGLFATLNWRWNAQKQEAYKLARGKRVEALALWKTVDPQSSHLAKDTFFQANYGGKALVVLRDGTIEVHGSHEDLQQDVTKSLGVGGSGLRGSGTGGLEISAGDA